MRIEVYADIACPWCYIGQRRLGRALEDGSGSEISEVVYRPYVLDGEAPVPGIPTAVYLERRFGRAADGMMRQATVAAREEGLPIDFERAISAGTFNAHRLLGWTEREGSEAQRRVAGELYAAHFARGLDVSDVEVLARAAAGAGLDPASAREFLAGSEGAAELVERLEGARRIGIRAVPTFVVDGHTAIQGALPSEALRRALESLDGRRPNGSARPAS